MKIALVLLLLFKTILCKIKIDVFSIKNDVEISYSGSDVSVVTDLNIEEFGFTKKKLNEALRNHYGRLPNEVYFKNPTPHDLYHKYHWEQTSRVLRIESAKIKNHNQDEMVILSNDFENFSNRTVKVNTGLSRSVENTLTIGWTHSKELTVSQEIEYDMNFIFAKVSGTTSMSYTTVIGQNKEITESVTLGTTTGMETELKPNQTVTSILTATKKNLEIEVTYLATLRGNLAVNFKTPHNGHHFWGPPIENIMKSGNLKNEIKLTEVVKVGTYLNVSLKVFDKYSKLPV